MEAAYLVTDGIMQLVWVIIGLGIALIGGLTASWIYGRWRRG
jgi:hypothetical protein